MIESKLLHELFPFFIEIRSNGDIDSIGKSLNKIFRKRNIINLNHFDYEFEVIRPGKIYNHYKDFEKILDQLLLLKSRRIEHLTLRGQLKKINNKYFYLGSLWLNDMKTIEILGVEISDFSLTDSLTDFLQLINTKDIIEKELIESNAILSNQTKVIKKTNHELNVQTTLLNDLIDSTEMGTWQWNVQTGETIFNDRWAEIIGYSLAEISPTNIETWMKYSHPDDLKISNERLKSHFDGKDDFYDVELRMIHKNGDIIWVRDKGKVFSFNGKGEPEWMYGTHQDITLEKNKRNDLLIQKLFYEGILNAIPADIAVFDKDHKYLFVNPKAISDESLRTWIIGKDDFDYCKKFGKSISIAKSRRATFDRALKIGSTTLEEKISGKSGDEFHLRHMFSVLNPQNEVTYVIGYGVNITAIKNAQIDLEKAKEFAEEEKNAKHLLLSTISHELRNPINAISSLISLHSNKTSNSDSDLLGSLKISAENIDSILKDILNDHSGKGELEEASYDFKKFISHISDVYKFQAQRKGLEFIVKFDSKIPNILTYDKKLISQILSNLLSNSIKYTSFGKISFFINKISSSHFNTLIEFVIQDTGIGIPNEMKNKIFERYERVKGNKEFGIGLGLSIVREKTNLLKGNLNLESTLEKGSRFEVQLNFKNTKSNIKSLSQDKELVEEIKSILVIDDELINFQVIDKLLENKNKIELTYLDNGLDALKQLKVKYFDVIIVDIKMPDISGFEFLQRYAVSKFYNKQTMLIACSSDFTKPINYYNFEGFDYFLEKPISNDNLTNTLNYRTIPQLYIDLALLNNISSGDLNFRKNIIIDLIKIINQFLDVSPSDPKWNSKALLLMHKLKGTIGYAANKELINLLTKDYNNLVNKEQINYLYLASKLSMFKEELKICLKSD